MSLNLADVGQLCLGAAGLVTAFGGVAVTRATIRSRGYAASASVSADAASTEATSAAQARTDVLLDLIASAEKSRAAMRRSIIRCPVDHCPTRAALLQEEPAP